ncbi:MAG: prepilin-type N-terminal cleavage/methylation domain-containing protein [Proteobacteria bacterium]|nr:prepilin-type N-terminal cleavage/methylation domain-containing protein [Pseudomonadota bacterium]MCG2741178.1 prepilin-type N-terminal cleavage/methylation domain-containing protein [Syntrophaceae bacterium]
MKIFKKYGFTLVEMMIVVAVMGIMSAIAAPNLMHYMAERRLNGAARMVMSDLMAARQRAVTQNNEFKVFFNTNQHEYTILDDDDNDGTADTGEATEVRNIWNDYYDVTLSASVNPIFTPRGTSTNGTTVTLSSAKTGVSKYVKAAWSGRVKIDDTP